MRIVSLSDAPLSSIVLRDIGSLAFVDPLPHSQSIPSFIGVCL